MSRPRPTAALQRAALFALALAAVPAAAHTSDWTGFRGPHGDGVAGVKLPGGPLALETVWKRPLGSGYSQIATSGKVGVTMTADGTNDVVVAFDLATGKDLWRYTLAPMYAGHDGSDDGPISSPAIVDGEVYTVGPRANVVSLELATGKLRWRRDLGEGEVHHPIYGIATAPVVHGDLVILATGAGERAVVGLRRKDGSEAWRWGGEGEKVSYQTPVLAQAGGEQQVVAFTDKHLVGLDPATGAERWRFAHSETGNAELGGQPVAIGGGRFLLQGESETIAVAVEKKDGAFAASELWRTTQLGNTFAVPIAHGDTVYGFTGRFLTAVDPATGKPRWKSRPPGGRGLTLAGEHLVVVGDGGDLVVARAGGEGYTEVARTKALPTMPYTYPTVVRQGNDTLILVRDLTEMAAVRVAEASSATAATATPAAAAMPAPAAGPAPVEAFATFLADLEKTPEAGRQAKVDAFFAANKTMPLVDPAGRVTFLARATQDAGVGGNWPPPDGDEIPLTRVAGTDLFHTTVAVDPAGLYEYRMSIDFGDPTADPLNPNTIGQGPQAGSVITMPGFRVARHLRSDFVAPAKKGTVETFEHESTIRPGKRTISVYLPDGYTADGTAKYPFLLVHHGGFTAGPVGWPAALDAVIADGTLPPTVAVFVPRATYAEYAGVEAKEYTRMVVEELLPVVEKKYRLRSDAAARGTAGPGTGAVAAVWSAFASPPGTFGWVGTQSYFKSGDVIAELEGLIATGPKRPLRAHVDIMKGDLADERQGFDAEKDSQRLVDTLKQAGYAVDVAHLVGGAGLSRYRATVDLLLADFAKGLAK